MANDLTLTSPTFNATGKFGQSLNGGYGRATPSPIPTNGTFTLEGYVKTTDTASVNVAFGQNSACWMGHISGKARGQYGGGSTEVAIVTSVTINDGLWHHLALCVDSTGGRFYVDGALAGSSSVTIVAAVAVYTNPLEVRTFASNTYNWLGEVDEVAITSTAKYTAAFTPAGTADTSPSLVAVYHLEGNGTNTATAAPAPGITWPANNASYVYSGSWDVTAVRAKTINAGQYVRTLVPAGTCNLNFDLTGIATPLPQVTVRINGKQVIRAEIAAAVAVPIDVSVSTQPYNLVEVFVAATTETSARWVTQTTAVQFLGITGSSTAALRTPLTRPLRIKIYGDSITEGVRALASTAPSGKDTDRNDSLGGWAMALMDYLGAEVDIVGFGGTGLLLTGSGAVPPLIQTYSSLWSGMPRNFAAHPSDLVIFMEGTNDGANDITAAYTAMLNQAITAESSTTKFLSLQPYYGTHGTEISNAVAACSAPAQVTYQNTVGYLISTDASDGLHPYAYSDMALIAPRVAGVASVILRGTSAAPSIPTGNLPVGLSMFKFIGAAAVNISGYSGLNIVWNLQDAGSWMSGKPNGPSTQAVNQFVPGRKYYVYNSSAAAIPLLGAQL